MFCLAVL